jgi:hypothetical protein
MSMAAGVAAEEKVTLRLQESLARLREDIDRVELWASALEGFLRPVPEYDAARRYRLAPDARPAPSEKNERKTGPGIAASE